MKTIQRWMEMLSVVILVLMVLVVLIQVFFRYILGNSLQWTEEIARLCLIWITFVGASILFIRDSHIKVDLIRWRGSSLLIQFRNLVVESGKLIIILTLTIYGVKMVNMAKGTLLPASQISMGLFMYSAITFSSFIMLVEWFFNFARKNMSK